MSSIREIVVAFSILRSPFVKVLVADIQNYPWAQSDPKPRRCTNFIGGILSSIGVSADARNPCASASI